MSFRKRSFNDSDSDDEYDDIEASQRFLWTSPPPGEKRRKSAAVIEESDSEEEDAAVDDDDNSFRNTTGESDSDSDSDDEDGEDEDSTEKDEENDLCPICLGEFEDQMVGIPENCKHMFCAGCIQEWTKNVNNCPVDRKKINMIAIHKCKAGPIIKQVPVEDKSTVIEISEDPPTYCEHCDRCDREETLLLCDECDNGYHMECLNPPLTFVPIDEWLCAECRPNEDRPTTSAIQRPQRRNSEATTTTTDDIELVNDLDTQTSAPFESASASSTTTAVRGLMFGQLVGRRARTAASAREEETSRISTTRGRGRGRGRRTTSQSRSTSSSKGKKKSKKKKRSKSRSKAATEKAKKKVIAKELKKFRRKHAARSNTDEPQINAPKSLAVHGNNLDLDGFFNSDDDFCYDDEKKDDTPRSTICDTPDVIGNILGGFNTLNPDNVILLRDGTVIPMADKTTEVKEQPEDTEDTPSSLCTIVKPQPRKRTSSSSSNFSDICRENAKRRKIKFLDESDDNDGNSDGDSADPSVKKNIAKQLRKGYLEKLKQKQKAQELQEAIEKAKKNSLNTAVNHSSLFSVAKFKIPKKAKSEVNQEPSTSAFNLNSPAAQSESPKKSKVSNVIKNAKQTISQTKCNSLQSCIPALQTITHKDNKTHSLASTTASKEKSKRLASIVAERKQETPKVRKEVLTLQERYQLHQAGRLKNIESRRKISDSSSTVNVTNPKKPVPMPTKPLKSIIRVRSEKSCTVQKGTKKDFTKNNLPKKDLQKKPISLQHYQERKLMNELFGEPAEKEDEKQQKKTVKFLTAEKGGVKTNCLESKKVSSTINENRKIKTSPSKDVYLPPPASIVTCDNDSMRQANPFGELLLKPPSTKKTPKYESPFPTATKNKLLTQMPSFCGEAQVQNKRPVQLDKKNTMQRLSMSPIPVGVVSPQQRPDTTIENVAVSSNTDSKSTKLKQHSIGKREKEVKQVQAAQMPKILTKELYISQVKDLLKPFYKKGQVNKEQWKALVKEAVEKIKINPAFYSRNDNISKLMGSLLSSIVGGSSKEV